ncbi:MAG TPA: DNA translocase FtsK [Solirubrobacteraceae bacterium]|nr:DNA translocase FtsK [Solirubrobacteraceae bacterium]
MPPARAKAAKRKPPARARRAGLRAHLPVFEQRHLDVIGLGLVCLGVFLAFPLYLGWDGGALGEAAVDGLASLAGVVGHAAPVALVLAGALMVLRPVLPSARPVRAGALCLFAAATLALAAGTLGLGPDGERPGFFVPVFFEHRGGAVGEALFWASSTLLSTVGAHILALFLFCAATLLLTGATIAGVMRSTGSGLADTSRALRAPLVERRARGEREPTGAEEHAARQQPVAPPAPRPVVPPEPEDQEPIVRATHVEAPSLDGAVRYPDLFGDDRSIAPADRAESSDHPPAPEEELPPDAEDDAPSDRADLESDPGEEPTAVVRAEDLTPQGRLRASVTDDPAFQWKLPAPRRVLTRSTAEQARPDTHGQQQTAAALVEALGHFGVEAKVVGTVAGPHITRYELRLAPGIKMSKVAQLKDDLAYALAAVDIRILAPIPGKTAVGIEVPNQRRRIVHLGDVFQDPPEGWSPLTVWLGKDVAGKAIGADLAKMPHLLVAGTTGAGKSGAVNAMLSSLLLRATPHDVRLVLVDPKQVELNHYEGIPHLLTPVITSPRKAANALANLVKEMEDRYGAMALAKTRSLPELNRARGQRGQAPLPYVLCIIDELADLMMVAPADVEDSIIRLAQKARAVGIHLVLATQSPRVDVITGMIKANVPSRIAFAVSSQTDSRVILDQNGAESRLGQGDMLFAPVGSSRLQRIQGAFIDEGQIAQLTDFWRRQGEPELRQELLDEVEDEEASASEDGEEGFDPDEDHLLPDAIRLVAEMQPASTSMLQRRLSLGYTRAGRLIDMLERRGVISGYEGSKPRQVLVTEGDVERVVTALGARQELPEAAQDGPSPPPMAEEEVVAVEVEPR